jgi:hypothetical protein
MRKHRYIDTLLASYRSAVNWYCSSLWIAPGKLDAETEHRLPPCRLTARYRSSCLKTALGIVISTRKALKATKKWGTCPVLTGFISLDAKFVSIEEGEKSFDYALRLSTLRSGKKVTIPFNAHKRLQYWLSKPGASLKQACQLSENCLKLYVEIPDDIPQSSGRVLGVDIGINKLITTSDNQQIGKNWRQLSTRIRAAKPGSENRKQLCRARTQFINHAVNQLPWSELSAIGIEDIKGMKTGKKATRGKTFRKALAPWLYRQLLSRIEVKASENRVRCLRVPAVNSSRECPRCGMVSKLNRRGEDFTCVSCGHNADADYVGASNILTRTLTILGSQSPLVPKAIIC